MKRFLQALALVAFAALAYMHWFLPARIESSMNRVLPHAPYVISARAERLHESLWVADLHSDSLLWKRDLSSESDVGMVDLPRLEYGNVALQVFSATTKAPKSQNYARNSGDSDQITLLTVASFWPPRTWNSLYERAAYQLEKLHRLASNTPLIVVTSKQGLRQLLVEQENGGDAIGAIYLIEGAHPLEGNIENLDRLFDQGLRIVGLTHFFDNELGGSLHGLSGEGLTEFGRTVIRRANELGMIIDVAHASPAMVADVLALSTSPPMLSHGGMKGACETPRNLPDDLMLQFAAKGGLIGIGYWDAAVCDATPDGIVRAMRYAIDTLGVEHVALGSDFDGAVATPLDTSELAILTETMLVWSFSEDEIRAVMGGNAQRFFLENLP